MLSFYTLAFAISWGGFLLVVGLGPGGFSATPQQLQKDVPYAVLAMVLGPGLAGILLTGRTVAIAAGMVAIARGGTRRTGVDMPTQRLSSTLFNRTHGLVLLN